MKRRLLLISVLATYGLGVSAQSASDSLQCSMFNVQSSMFNLQSSMFNVQCSMDDVKRSDPWLTSQNAAALVRFAGRNIAEAELSLTKAKGGLTNFDGSPDALQADAAVESFFHLSPRTVVFGAMSYSNFSGKDMAGSALIGSQFTVHSSQLSSAQPNVQSSMFNVQSSHRPFDLVEDSLTNTGTKHLDTYRLTGGFGYSVTDGFAVGARLDYTAANYAKYKDLRHQNKLMDLQLTAGVYAPVAPWLQLGAHYLYHRNTESVLFSTFGKTDRVYKTLIDYANFTGTVEQFGADGYTDRSREMPLVNDCNGGGIAFNVQCSMFSLYNAFTYAHRRGYYGRKSPYTITYTDHESDVYTYTARLTHQLNRLRHYLDLTIQAENLQNNAATFREQQNDAGATYYEYYTPVKTANKLWVDGTVSYTIDLWPRSEFEAWQGMLLPTWTFCAAMNWMHRKQTAYLYPYYRRQTLDNNVYAISITRNIVCKRGVWSLTADAAFLKGSGQPCENFTFAAASTLRSASSDPAATPADMQQAPASMDAYLYREYQWLTAAQYQIGGTVKYAFIFPSTKMKTYVKASLSHRKSNETNIYSAGCDRTTATIATGCCF